jgi:hypothetical protein
LFFRLDFVVKALIQGIVIIGFRGILVEEIEFLSFGFEGEDFLLNKGFFLVMGELSIIE